MSNSKKPNKPKPTVPVVTHSAARKKITDLSAPVLLRIHALPRFIVPALMAIFLVLGLFLKPPISGISLSVVCLFVAWLMYLSWPLLDPRSKFIRFTVLMVLIAATFVNFVAF
jgi:ABC-type multidrug transport system fused ATPase/permease subunit